MPDLLPNIPIPVPKTEKEKNPEDLKKAEALRVFEEINKAYKKYPDGNAEEARKIFKQLEEKEDILPLLEPIQQVEWYRMRAITRFEGYALKNNKPNIEVIKLSIDDLKKEKGIRESINDRGDRYESCLHSLAIYTDIYSSLFIAQNYESSLDAPIDFKGYDERIADFFKNTNPVYASDQLSQLYTDVFASRRDNKFIKSAIKLFNKYESDIVNSDLPNPAKRYFYDERASLKHLSFCQKHNIGFGVYDEPEWNDLKIHFKKNAVKKLQDMLDDCDKGLRYEEDRTLIALKARITKIKEHLEKQN
jgi:hypothetical protein